MGAQFDLVDGGVATVFVDGPKKGQMGVVTPERDGAPPPIICFMPGNALIYQRVGRVMLTANDGVRRRRVRGVSYKMDPTCHLAKEAARVDMEALVESGQMGVQR
jgi:hypothetical protein